jgi:hypothetical protein
LDSSRDRSRGDRGAVSRELTKKDYRPLGVGDFDRHFALFPELKSSKLLAKMIAMLTFIFMRGVLLLMD